MIEKIKNGFHRVYKEIISILKLKTSPKKIALGVAIAVFWNFLPSLGAGALLSFIAARILQASAVTAVTVSLATGILIPFFYTLNIFTGRFVVFQMGLEGISNLDLDLESLLSTFPLGLQESELFLPMLSQIKSVSIDFLIGSVINAFIAGAIMYITFWIILMRKKSV